MIMKKNENKFTTKMIAQTGLLLALCIASQFLKNLSPLITGPIVNCIIIIATVMVGLPAGIIISVIAPVTSFFIAPSPILAGIPLIVPAVMAGNCILSASVWFFTKKMTFRGSMYAGMAAGSALKALFMGALIVGILLPLFDANIAVPGDKLDGLISKARFMFGAMQLITSLVGSAVAAVILIPLKKAVRSEQQ